MTAALKMTPKLFHQVVTLSGLGHLTQRQIVERVGGAVKQQTISKACAPYRQKKIEKEELFSLKDVRVMTGIKRGAAIRTVAEREQIGTLLGRYRLYCRDDIDRLLVLLSPPVGKQSCGEVAAALRVAPPVLREWAESLKVQPEKRFGTLYFSPDEVGQIKSALALAKLNLTVKKLAYHTGTSYSDALRAVRERGYGRFVPNRHSPRSLFLAQGEYVEVCGVLLARAAVFCPSRPAEPAVPHSGEGLCNTL